MSYWSIKDVELDAEIIENDFVVRKLKYNQKMIVHLQYLGWPDHGIPNDLNSFSVFVQKCEQHININTGTIIVHCR